MFEPARYLDLSHTEHRAIFEDVEHVWQVLAKISSYLKANLQPANHGTTVGNPFIGENVYIGKGTIVEHGAMIKGPAWIGENCEVRNGCYIRENVILGDGVIAGNSSEFKNCLVFDEAQVPHYNYVGDAVLGHKAHLGAGVILSNVKLDKKEVSVTGSDGRTYPTGLRKFSAIVGDHAEVGCNSVLSPGSLIGRNTIVYPGSQWRGVLPEGHIAKIRQQFDIVQRRGL